MLTVSVLFISSLAAALLITPLIRDAALRIGWVDEPDGARKVHRTPIPRVGGIAVFLVYGVALCVLALVPLHATRASGHSFELVWRLLPAAAVAFATGFLDDLFDLSPWKKLAGQLGASVLACVAGVRIGAIAGTDIPSWIGLPLTLAWLVVCANAFNLIDGLDGLAAGIALFATLTALISGLLHGDFGFALATAPLAGALAGFLRFNFNPASVFLGDAGSLGLGFLLGCYSVVSSQKSATMLGMTAPLMALAVPLCDTGLSVARRFLRSKPIFSPDRAHIHHRLLDLGLTPRRVVLVLYGASGLAACFSLLWNFLGNEWRALGFFAFCAAAWAGIHRLGYQEFQAAAGVLRLRLLRRLLTEQLRLRSFEQSLATAVTPDDCWRTVRDAAREFGFTSVMLQLNGMTYSEALRADSSGQWSVRIPLSGPGYVLLTRAFECSDSVHVIAPFAEFLYRSLRANSNPALTAAAAATAPQVHARLNGSDPALGTYKEQYADRPAADRASLR